MSRGVMQEERVEMGAGELDGGAPETDRGRDRERLAAIVESVLFANGEPVALRRLVEILAGPSPAEVREALEQVRADCAAQGRGVRLIEVSGGYQLRTARENAEWVRAAFRERPRRLGRAALETLAVIAYRQPITRAEIEAIRGVDVDAVLNTLTHRGLVKAAGRKEAVGRPWLYVTTEAFLGLFGLRDLSELPTLKEMPAVAEAEEQPQEQPHEEAGAGEGNTTAEAAEPGGSGLTAEGGGADPGGEGAGERPGGDGAGDEGGPASRSD